MSCWYNAVLNHGSHQCRWQIRRINAFCFWQTPLSYWHQKLLWDTNFTVAVNECFCFFCVWLDSSGASSPIELWEAFGVLCLIELLWGAAGLLCVFSLIELFLGPVEAGSARQSPLIFFNDVASVFVNFHAAAPRRGLLWLTSQKDKWHSLLDADEGTITSTLPKSISATSEYSEKFNSLYRFCLRGRDFFLSFLCTFLMRGGTFWKIQHCVITWVCIEIVCSFNKFLRFTCKTVDFFDEDWERA